ncbi:hypothetical protein D3C73_670930 [compost metagenome]
MRQRPHAFAGQRCEKVRASHQEQPTTEQLHGKPAECEGARLQMQPHEYRRRTGQRPGDRGAVYEEEQRRQQIEEGQPQARQHRHCATLP